MHKIMIWCVGANTISILKGNRLVDCDIIAFIDSNNESFEYGNVYKPKEALKLMDEVEYILITTSNKIYSLQILLTALELGYEDRKLLFLYNNFSRTQNDIFLKTILPEPTSIGSSALLKLNLSYLSDSEKKSFLGSGIFSRRDQYLLDYFRFRTFELTAAEIIKNSVPGNTAELGVFRGVFSRLIHAHLPQKTHYMYDSFQGFDEGYLNEIMMDYSDERKKTSLEWADSFKDTSVDIVMQDMPSPQTCVIREGLFPGTLTNDDEKEVFAFVSLDVDLEEPTYQGLHFFFPRISEGGYMFIHDYNAGGVQRAIRRYEVENGIVIKGVHLADRCGTLVVAF